MLPYPPSVNHYKNVGRLITTKSGKMYQQRIDSPETKRFYYEVWLKVMQEKAKEGFKSFEDSTIPLSVYISLYPPDKRRRDIDNPLKLIFDSLVKAKVMADDSQIIKLYVEKRPPIQGGQIIVLIEPI